MSDIKLTAYSHGAGCGCKISPAVLDRILHSVNPAFKDPRLLIGNETKDDAAVYAIDDEKVIISTTDFFMPVVDDPFDFGAIASVNAISDIYAMGGTPLMAISILGWPVNLISAEHAREVVEGARDACKRAGIALAGGHSIDTPEPIFGLAVTGVANRKNIKANNTAINGCELFLTKPLGIGILTTAHKMGILREEHLKLVKDTMLNLNIAGQEYGKLDCVKALTDVTGFGLLGHLIEMCEGSGVSARIFFDKVPRFLFIGDYIHKKTIPGGTKRNFESYGHKVTTMDNNTMSLLCDPQTSGGLLVAVDPAGKDSFLEVNSRHEIKADSFGYITPPTDPLIIIK
jgi:selenide,water dikinase